MHVDKKVSCFANFLVSDEFTLELYIARNKLEHLRHGYQYYNSEALLQ